MAQKKGLGRGLNDLLGTSEAEVEVISKTPLKTQVKR